MSNGWALEQVKATDPTLRRPSLEVTKGEGTRSVVSRGKLSHKFLGLLHTDWVHRGERDWAGAVPTLGTEPRTLSPQSLPVLLLFMQASVPSSCHLCPPPLLPSTIRLILVKCQLHPSLLPLSPRCISFNLGPASGPPVWAAPRVVVTDAQVLLISQTLFVFLIQVTFLLRTSASTPVKVATKNTCS